MPLFQIRTATNFVCGAQIPMEMQVTVPGEGTFAFNFIIPGSTNCGTSGGGLCESCSSVAGLFTTNLPAAPLLQYSPVPSACGIPTVCPGLQSNTNLPMTGRYQVHRFTNTTARELCVTAAVRPDCGPASSPFGVAAYLGSFDTNDVCAGYLGDSSSAPRPFSFPVPAGSNFVIVAAVRTTNIVCDAYTLEVFGLPCPPPRLQIANDAAPGKIRVNWSTAYPGWNLQRTGQLPGTFSNSPVTPAIAGSRYVQTNATAGTNQFYRLMK